MNNYIGRSAIREEEVFKPSIKFSKIIVVFSVLAVSVLLLPFF
jgi:hypothetical protein